MSNVEFRFKIGFSRLQDSLLTSLVRRVCYIMYGKGIKCSMIEPASLILIGELTKVPRCHTSNSIKMTLN